MELRNVSHIFFLGLVIFLSIAPDQSEGRLVTLDHLDDTYDAIVGNSSGGNLYNVSFRLPSSLCPNSDVPQCMAEEYSDPNNPIIAPNGVKWTLKTARADKQSNPDAVTVELTEYSNVNINKKYAENLSIMNRNLRGFYPYGNIKIIEIGNIPGKIQFGNFSEDNGLNKIESSISCFSYPPTSKLKGSKNVQCLIILKIPNNESTKFLKNFTVDIC